VEEGREEAKLGLGEEEEQGAAQIWSGRKG
jgi:hypothetical protein